MERRRLMNKSVPFHERAQRVWRKLIARWKEKKKKRRRAQVRIAGGSPGPDVVLLVPLWEERPPFLRSSQLPVITLSRNDLVTVSVFGIRFCSLHVPLRQLPKRPPELSRRDSRSGDSHVDRWPGMVNPLISFQQVETMLPE